MYIVTGGAGFIGSVMVRWLNESGIDDILVVDNLASTDKWKNLVKCRYSDYLHRDEFIGRVRSGRISASSLNAIIHLGACSSTTELNADFLMENNFRYTRDLCLFAVQGNIPFITASSAATYGDGSLGFSDSLEKIPSLRPLNMYAYSKQLFDLWLLRNKLLNRVFSLKFFNVYGPNEYHKGEMISVVNRAYHSVKATGRMSLFASDTPDYPDGGQMRDFIYVKDCVKLIAWLLEHPEAAGIHNVGTGCARTWNDLVANVFLSLNLPCVIDYIPMPSHLRGKYQNYTQADMGWLYEVNCPLKFCSLEEGIHDYLCSYLETPDPYI